MAQPPEIDVRPNVMERAIRIAAYAESSETRALLSSVCQPPVFELLDVPCSPEDRTVAEMCAFSEGADLILLEVTWSQRMRELLWELRYTTPEALIAVCSTDVSQLGAWYRGGLTWSQWVQDHQPDHTGLPPIDTWVQRPLTRETVGNLLLCTIATILAPTGYALLVEPPGARSTA